VEVRLESEQEYLGYTIHLLGVTPGDFPGLAAVVTIKGSGGQQVCRFTELLDRQLQGGAEGWPEDDEQATQQLMERALHRARGTILLDRLGDIDTRRHNVSQGDGSAQRSDDYLRALILDAFKRGFRHNPALRGRIQFDDIGVALVEEVDRRDVEYCLERLVLDGLIKSWSLGHEPGARLYMPTAAGLTEADRLSVPSQAPGFLLEETVAKVESCLNKYQPELVDSLRRQSVRIAETKELGEHEVGEIAQACEQIIQDYRDLDVLWGSIGGERPPKGNTRDRLRSILKARVPSDTESDLLEALEAYVVGWFGRLEKFVHKHRHLPGESDRRQAKRCVIYTYLLLADLSELLDL